ncbi:MAG: lipid biosynthesis B12-binding/radical SAM protein [Verrucomicrobia bacterium]|nr:lipid biosynthesis B12-binding/radical SAM protein [Verrucomicrobiota bacterium]MBT7065467.1 lipid biosynthesis B12-binding/radical SAM protein [Verrucomicrobiota bacterium]
MISANLAKSPHPVYPLGMSIIANALESSGHHVIQFDFLQHDTSLPDVAAAVQQHKPDLVGISLRNIDSCNALNERKYVDGVRQIIEVVRRESSAPVVLGGSGFSIMPETVLDTVGADYGIVGEGERAIVDFVEKASRGEFPKERCLRAEPGLQGREILSARYDADIMSFYRKNGNIAGLQTKRGCTHKCVYCSYPVLEGPRIRPRDPALVVDDIRTLTEKHGASHIFFTDSVFNDDAGRYLELVHEMRRQEIKTPWLAFFKPDGLNDENVALMRETGLCAAEIGSDAASDAALKGLGKGFCFKDVLECTELLGRHGIAAAHYFMFGCPGETPELVLEGIENIKQLEKAAVFVFMGIRILPGTALVKIARRDGLISDDDKDLLEPAYYISPALDRKWLEQTLTEALGPLDNCAFPPDAVDHKLDYLHRLGYEGPLWDLLLKERERKLKRRSRLKLSPKTTSPTQRTKAHD